MMQPHPVRIVVTDDLVRSRLTVFFRAILAIPHYLWAFLLGMVVALLVFVNWFILLVKARTPDGIHGFVAGYIRYLTHLEAARKALHDAADWLDQAGLPVEATMARNAAAYKG